MVLPILRYGEHPLHKPAAPVPVVDDDVRRLVDNMIETMYAAPGVGLAATQVGVPLRVFVVDVSVGRNPRDLLVMINPGFVERDGMQLEEEGCLSVPGFNATVVRPVARRRQGPRSERQPNRLSKARTSSPARSSTRWIISTAWCSSTGCAASRRI